ADFLVEKELHYRIENALAELPEKCREVFLLNRNEQLRYREIAEKLGISLKTVETRMSKALNHLRKRLLEFTGVLALLIRLFQG
ncbi:sigma-70 family RNA polymerase sigma factor, partial [Lentimicrobium sp.]